MPNFEDDVPPIDPAVVQGLKKQVENSFGFRFPFPRKPIGPDKGKAKPGRPARSVAARSPRAKARAHGKKPFAGSWGG